MAMGIGMLALSEVFLHLHRMVFQSQGEHSSTGIYFSNKPEDKNLSLAEIKASIKSMIRSSGIGTFLGIMPGLGAILAAYLGYGGRQKVQQGPGFLRQGQPGRGGGGRGRGQQRVRGEPGAAFHSGHSGQRGRGHAHRGLCNPRRDPPVP